MTPKQGALVMVKGCASVVTSTATSTRVELLRLCEYAGRMARLLLFLLPLSLLARVVYGPRNSGVWIFAEREGEACDNAFALFKYVREHYPGIDAVFVSRSDGKNRQGILRYGSVVPHRSIRHYWLYAKSSVAISTHVYGASPEGSIGKLLSPVNPGRLVAAIKHGISKDHYSLFEKRRTGVDLFITAVPDEFNYYSMHCGYAEYEIRLTGFCRFDRFTAARRPKRQILFMPTFRRSLHNLSRLPRSRGLKEFGKSDYFANVQSLLDSPLILSLLSECEIELLFCPHPRIFPFLSAFSPLDSRIRIVDSIGPVIPNLIDECAMLITDYSSVFFDFAMLGRPIVYFQFDKAAYRKNHYKEGYFDYRRDGFGPVAETVQDVAEAVRRYTENEFNVEDEYNRRSGRFFYYRDSRHCERVFRAIVEHPKMRP